MSSNANGSAASAAAALKRYNAARTPAAKANAAQSVRTAMQRLRSEAERREGGKS